MSTCSNCGREISEGETKCPGCGQEVSAQTEETVRVRAVPNIPRRDPDPLPERPASSGGAGGKFSAFLLIAAVILVLVYVIFLRK